MLGKWKHPALTRSYGGAPSMTPLIDVVFLLIVFFMLVAQISRYRTVDMTLAEVGGGARADESVEERVIIEVMPDGGYRFGTKHFEATEQGAELLAGSLAEARAQRARAVVRVRADRGEAYERVAPVLRALRDAGFTGAELAVQDRGEGGGG